MATNQCDGYRNVDENTLIAAIKTKLMSREDNWKFEAVELLYKYLQSHLLQNGETYQKVCDRLIEADIVEYLGEAIATQDSLLLRGIFRCLELFLVSKKFSTQIRAAYITECLQRTIYFLFKKSGDYDLANDGLRLFAVLIEEFHKTLSLTQLFGNQGNITQVVNLIASLLERKEEFCDEMVINANLVLFSLLSQNDNALVNYDCLNELPNVIEKSLTSLTVLCNSSDYQMIHNKLITLMIKIGNGGIRFCLQLASNQKGVNCVKNGSNISQGKGAQDEDDISGVHVGKKIISCVFTFAENIWLPSIMQSNFDHSTSELFFNFLSCTRYLYWTECYEVRNFSEVLGKIGFTTLLPLLLNWSCNRQFHQLRIVVEEVMVEFIACLSEKQLHSAKWLERDDLKMHFAKGIRALPAHFKDWWATLGDQTTAETGKHFVIIYFYFFCLFLPSPPSCELSLNHLWSYLSTLQQATCPFPVLKALWFLYSEAALCGGGGGGVAGPEAQEGWEALLRLMAPLRPQLHELYTHHPALLYWTFCSPRAPQRLQLQVAEEDEEFDAALVKLGFTNEDVIFCLLEVIKYSTRKVVPRAVRVLGKAIANQKEKASVNIVSLLWDTLPNTLAEYCSLDSALKGYNISNFMLAACFGIPPNPSSKIILQCGIYIMKVLMLLPNGEKMEVESRGPVIEIALMTLVMAMKRKDQRVLLNYINEVEFVKLVYETSGCQCPMLIQPSINLLLQIYKYYQDTAPSCVSQKKEYTFHIDVIHILYLLIQEKYEILLWTLNLVYEILSSDLPEMLMVIVSAGRDDISVSFLLILFRHLQNLCCKNVLNVSRNSFKAMGSILHYAFKTRLENNIFEIIATHPWTHVVLRAYFSRRNPEISTELLYFLCWWFHLYIYQIKVQIKCFSTNVRARKRSRAPYPSLFSETTERIARALLDVVPLKNHQTNSLALKTISRILLLDTNISQGIVQGLRNKLIEENVEIPFMSHII